MTQVKSYVMTYTLPKIINKTLPYVTSEFTLSYLDLFDQAMLIENHLRDYNDYKINHY